MDDSGLVKDARKGSRAPNSTLIALFEDGASLACISKVSRQAQRPEIAVVRHFGVKWCGEGSVDCKDWRVQCWDALMERVDSERTRARAEANKACKICCPQPANAKARKPKRCFQEGKKGGRSIEIESSAPQERRFGTGQIEGPGRGPWATGGLWHRSTITKDRKRAKKDPRLSQEVTISGR